jgi:hypothetical protein
LLERTTFIVSLVDLLVLPLLVDVLSVDNLVFCQASLGHLPVQRLGCRVVSVVLVPDVLKGGVLDHFGMVLRVELKIRKLAV